MIDSLPLPLLAMIRWEEALLLIGIILLIASVFSLGRSRKKKKSANAGTPHNMGNRDYLARARQTQRVRNDMDGLMVELEEMAKRIGAQLDAKTLYMEKVIREADQRILQLQTLQSAGLPTPQEAGRAENTSPVQDEDNEHADPLTREVYALADQGNAPDDIAASLKEPVGKIELILALRSVG